MNLFVEELANYVINAWDNALHSGAGQHEARFILQSLGPEETLALFERFATHARDHYEPERTRWYFRAAKGLWVAWDRKAKDAADAVRELERNQWVDRNDQLTWYRNRLARDEGVDGLVVVLVGLNHATDQGGLADFHVVDEHRIQQQLGDSFGPWLERIGERLGLSPTGTQLERFDDFLRTLRQLRPLQLGRLARFLEPLIQQGQCYSFNDFRERVFQSLPFWDIPPILAAAQAALPDGGAAVKALKDAEAFISHLGYKTPATQKRDLNKLETAIAEPGFVLPVKPDGGVAFTGKNDFSTCLRAFIERADPDARERLLGTDITPIIEALRKRNENGNGTNGPSRIPAFDDLSINAFLQALWDALLKFEGEIEGASVDERLGDMTLQLVAIEHDYRSADDDSNDKEAVRGLLKGLLGGLDDRFREIGEALSERWQRTLRLHLETNPDALKIEAVRGSKRPSVLFRVNVADADGRVVIEDTPYRWFLDATQPERVRHDCIEKAQREWDERKADAGRLLPAFRVRKVNLTALFYASDAEEANRLVASAMQDMKLLDLRAGLADSDLAQELLPPLNTFIGHYREWLHATLEHGYYKALQCYVPRLMQAYTELAKILLDTSLLGARDLLCRVYKALLLIDDEAQPGDPYLANCVAWGLSPSVLELSLAQTRFLADGFPEILDELAKHGPSHAKRVFERLLNLSRIQRPVTALVKNKSGDLTTRVRELGLLHCIGEVEPGAKSLAVQTLLKDDESEDEEDLSKVLRRCEEQRIVKHVIDLYAELHHFAADGLRILAANVSDLSVILLGVQQYLEAVLKEHSDYPPFECTLMVYSTSASPLAMENRLSRWREQVLEHCKEGERPLLITVGHRYAPRALIGDQLKQERHRYDLAFLFHFLRTDMDGKIETATPFDVPRKGMSSFFPIAEYPRPIQATQHDHREMLLSNRRLLVQTRHADLSARLRYQGDRAPEHLVLGQVDFNAWAEPVQALHQAAQWVACIDSFVDKRLLGARGGGRDERRKIVGFESGLGDYGELNLTISTEQDTLDRLTRKVSGELGILLLHQPAAATDEAAERVVAKAEEVAGLASLRAVLGRGQQIREVVGYAAINRMLTTPDAMISQLLPLDAMQDWLAEPGVEGRPDLLQLSLEAGEDGVPLIHATVIECKVANRNSVHTDRALKQVRSGLFQLSRVLAPRCELFAGLTFDRRYWWAQLQRAIASRGEVNLSGDDWNHLNAALERVVEGQYLICWRGMVFTFWSDIPGPLPTVIPHVPTERVVPSSVEVPAGFCIEQVELGHQGLASLFGQASTPRELRVKPRSPGICIAYGEMTESPSWEIAVPNAVTTRNDEDSAATADDKPEPSSGQAVASDDSPIDSAPSEAPAAGVAAADRSPQPSAGPDSEKTTGTSPATSSTPGASAATPVPERILIGARPNGEPVYWHFGHPKLSNRHLLLFGTSGSGKTYGIQCLLAEMATAGLRSLIVDYTDGFLPGQMETRFQEAARPKSHFVATEQLPLNPFRRQRQEIDPSLPLLEETNYQVASRIVSIFASVYTVGEQQLAALSRSLQVGLETGSGFTLDALLPILREDGSQGLSLANKIEPFIQARPFRAGAESAWDDMLVSPEHGVHVLQLKGLAREIQRMVTEFVLWDLWDYAQNTGSKERPVPIVLDEIQNLDHSSDSPIDKMLREGRKFGIAMMLATQTTSNFNTEQRDRLFQAGHKLFFKPATTETDRFAQILAQASPGVSRADWAERLARLEKGQCWSLGPVPQPDGSFKETAVLVSVTALEQRAFGA